MAGNAVLDYKQALLQINASVVAEFQSSHRQTELLRQQKTALTDLIAQFEHKLGANYLYKAYEILACVDFLLARYDLADQSIEQAILRHGSEYPRVMALKKLVNKKRQLGERSRLRAVRRRAKLKIYLSIACFMIGGVVVEVIHLTVHATKPQPAIPSSALHLNGSYFTIFGTIAIGGWFLIIGSKELVRVRKSSYLNNRNQTQS
jgi:hypothetical protein